MTSGEPLNDQKAEGQDVPGWVEGTGLVQSAERTA